MATTVTYTTDAQVKALLPRSYSTTDLPDSSDTTYTSLATHRIKASREVDSALAPYFCTFNATDHSTYPTPQYIQDIATHLAAARCFDQLGIGDRNTAYGARAQMHREKAQGWLDRLMGVGEDGAQDPRYYVLAQEVVGTETLTFGTGGEFNLTSREAFIPVQTYSSLTDIPTILPDSVKVTATDLTLYALGRDFEIRFDPMHQRWVFRDLSGDLSAAASPTITYNFTWKRHAEKQVAESDAATPYIGGWQ